MLQIYDRLYVCKSINAVQTVNARGAFKCFVYFFIQKSIDRVHSFRLDGAYCGFCAGKLPFRVETVCAGISSARRIIPWIHQPLSTPLSPVLLSD